MKALEEFRKLKTDKDKWLWLQKNQDKGLIVNLDNDDTFVTVKDNPDCDDYVDFDRYIGWSGGVQELLEAMGIEAEPV